MGIILDFVPNHMGVGGADNALWLDVLRHGEASKYSQWFDIDWNPPRAGMAGKLLVPFLGSSYSESLAAGDIGLRNDADGFAVWAYGSEKLPIRPEDTASLLHRHGTPEAAIAADTGLPGQPDSWRALDSLIASQHWRLAHFSVAADEINYRRFFINSDLAGIRVERADVFDHAHALIFSLIDEGLVDGLRIDHVDGLLDPKVYLETLRAKSPRPIYLVIEKILAPHEHLRADWPVDGTTGYEIGTQLTRVLMVAESEQAVTKTYSDFVGETIPLSEQVYRCKLRVMDNELAAELAALSRRFADIAWSLGPTADLTELGLRRALRETIAHLSVYRTYVDDNGFSDRDHREIGRAIELARRSQRQIQPALFDFVEALLCGRLGSAYDPRAIASAIGRFQQFTGPVMAKGFEDTALYRDNRLVALNEVGAHPDRFSMSIAAFHDANRRRLATHPGSMVATSTHDTKRGEDIRAIIAAIGDHPQEWANAVSEWRELLQIDGRDAIHPDDLYLFFQLLFGGWPLVGDAASLGGRLQGAMEKSLREARLRSDWGVNDTNYEAKVSAFIKDALANSGFLENFQTSSAPLRETGRRKAMIQTALKLTIPGVPDIYRGAEDWEQSFVDPDNRRVLDFSALASRLSKPVPGQDDKLSLTQRLLNFRREQPMLFARGTYEPIHCGAGMLAFRRRYDGAEITVLVDLSTAHRASLPSSTVLPTLYGSENGPVWILGA
jgi:(1->4)-alpha-D-glucan 1-alpha-D-glucosylmutase